MRVWLVSLALLALPITGWADFSAATGPISPDIVSLEAGIICPPETVGTAPAPGTIAGTTHIIDLEPPFVSNSRRVPAVLGIGFGIKSQTSLSGGLDGVIMVVSHPEMGERDVTAQSFVTRISDSNPSLTFYQFDYAYELLPGPWRMTAMRDDAVLFEVAFEVVPPSAVPELADVCGYLDLLS
jgi:hypothetical protein